jgi:hypothetical protein
MQQIAGYDQIWSNDDDSSMTLAHIKHTNDSRRINKITYDRSAHDYSYHHLSKLKLS